MAYDVALAQRIANVLKGRSGIEQKHMFGGVCFLSRGHMCCGVAGKKLMVRVGPERYEAALRKPYARPMDLTGRPLRGFVFVMPQGLRGQNALATWVDLGLRYATSLPAKRTSLWQEHQQGGRTWRNT